MFEKEAEEYLKKLLKRLKIKEKDLAENQPEILSWEKMNFVSLDVSNVSKAFQKGAEFGYNKANEWHYPSKGEYPSNRNDVYLLQLEDDNGHTEYEIGSLGSDKRWTCEEFGIRVIAWKEIVLPELKESE